MMRVLQQTTRLIICLCAAGAIPAHGFAQTAPPRDQVTGGPFSGPAVTNAPFSADATTTLRQTLADGTRITRTGTARYYRDSAGRVRVEQSIIGIAALSPAAEGQVRITVQPDPVDRTVYTLDPLTRTARRGHRGAADMGVGGGNNFTVPLGGVTFMDFHRAASFPPPGSTAVEASLGPREIDGLNTTGRRVTTTIPAGQVGNDRDIVIVDERWESRELKMLVYSRSSDPRSGVVEYRLTNIRRREPSAELFEVEPKYTIVPVGTESWLRLSPASHPKYGGRGGQ